MLRYKNRAEMIEDIAKSLLLLAVILALVYLGVWGFFTLGRMVLRAIGL